MNWLTKEYIESEAKKGKLEAVNCSIEHYGQMCNCTEEEFREGIDELSVGIHHDFCALCGRHNGTGKNTCPLGDCEEMGACCAEWEYMHSVFDCWQKGQAAFSKLQSKMQVVLDRLKSERDKLLAKKVCKKEPELRHGDVRWHHPNDPIFLMGNDWYNYDHKLYGDGKNDETWSEYPFRFNIFDDLKQLAEPLREYKAECCQRDCAGSIELSVDLSKPDPIEITIDNHGRASYISFTIEKFSRLLMAGRRLIATAKMEKEKCSSHSK